MTNKRILRSSSASSSRRRSELLDCHSDLIVVLDLDDTLISSKLFASKADADAYVSSLPTAAGTPRTGMPTCMDNAKTVEQECSWTSATGMTVTTTGTTRSRRVLPNGQQTVEFIQTEFVEDEDNADDHDAAESSRQKASSRPSASSSLLSNKILHVNIRPGLYEFLDDVCGRYETHLYSSCVPLARAKQLARMLDPEGVYFSEDRIWGREHCSCCGDDDDDETTVTRSKTSKKKKKKTKKKKTAKKQYWKDLSRLSLVLSCGGGDESLKRVVLVDSGWLNLEKNRSNTLLLEGFQDDPRVGTGTGTITSTTTNNDDLSDVFSFLVTELEDCDDVRPILTQKSELEHGWILQFPHSCWAK